MKFSSNKLFLLGVAVLSLGIVIWIVSARGELDSGSTSSSRAAAEFKSPRSSTKRDIDPQMTAPVPREGSQSFPGSRDIANDFQVSREMVVDILRTEPTSDRTEKLLKLVNGFDVLTVLSDPSLFPEDQLTLHELQSIGVNLSHRLSMATDLDQIKAAMRLRESPFFPSIVEGVGISLSKMLPPTDVFNALSSWEIDNEIKVRAVREASFRLGKSSSGQTSKVLEADRDLFEQYADGFVAGWASRDPESATLWALEATNASNDKAGNRSRVLTTAYESWVARDSYLASKWLAGQTSNSSYDLLASVIIRNLILVDNDFQNAEMWILSLRDEKERVKMLRLSTDFEKRQSN